MEPCRLRRRCIGGAPGEDPESGVASLRTEGFGREAGDAGSTGPASSLAPRSGARSRGIEPRRRPRAIEGGEAMETAGSIPNCRNN